MPSEYQEDPSPAMTPDQIEAAIIEAWHNAGNYWRSFWDVQIDDATASVTATMKANAANWVRGTVQADGSVLYVSSTGHSEWNFYNHDDFSHPPYAGGGAPMIDWFSVYV